jgi:hypothetical protein
MYTRDPYDVPTPRQPKPETPDHIKAFYGQLPDMRPTMPAYDRGRATLNACRFDTQAKRVYHLRGGCPHFDGNGNAR